MTHVRYLLDWAEDYRRITTVRKLRKKLVDIFSELCSNIEVLGLHNV